MIYVLRYWKNNHNKKPPQNSQVQLVLIKQDLTLMFKYVQQSAV